MMETFISIDVETNGRVPGQNSMISLGAAAFDEQKLLDTFSVNLRPLLGAKEDPDTMAWWKRFPEAYEAATKNALPAIVAIKLFVMWYEQYPNPAFVFYPAKFDAPFVYTYLYTFGKKDFITSPPLYDIKTMAAMVMDVPVGQADKRHWPRTWKTKHRHDHVAVNDAVEQGEQFLKILAEQKRLKDRAWRYDDLDR
jgi:hypothetical protein